MEVDRPALPAAHPRGRKDGEEPGQHDELGPAVLEFAGEPRPPFLRIDPVGREHEGRQAAEAGPLNRGCVGAVGDHERHARGEITAGDPLGERLQGRPLAGDEQRDRRDPGHGRTREPDRLRVAEPVRA